MEESETEKEKTNNKLFRSNRMLKAMEIGYLLDEKGEDYGNCLGVLYKEYGMMFFTMMLANKLERLKNLNKKESVPKYESINDTLKDIAGYAILALIEMEKAESSE